MQVLLGSILLIIANTEEEKEMDTIKVALLFMATFALVVHCQQSLEAGTCSNEVIVMTKDEMKREIQSQIADALASSAAGNLIGNCSSAGEKERENSKFNQVIEKLEDISSNLAAITKKLINLHQPGMTASHPATSYQEVYDFNPNITSGYY